MIQFTCYRFKQSQITFKAMVESTLMDKLRLKFWLEIGFPKVRLLVQVLWLKSYLHTSILHKFMNSKALLHKCVSYGIMLTKVVSSILIEFNSNNCGTGSKYWGYSFHSKYSNIESKNIPNAFEMTFASESQSWRKNLEVHFVLLLLFLFFVFVFVLFFFFAFLGSCFFFLEFILYFVFTRVIFRNI